MYNEPAKHFIFLFLIAAWVALGLLDRWVARRDSEDKDSEFESFVFGSFWVAFAARGTWCELGFKYFELKRDFSFPIGFNFNSSHVYDGVLFIKYNCNFIFNLGYFYVQDKFSVFPLESLC